MYDIRQKFNHLWAKRELMQEDYIRKSKLQQQTELRYNNALKARILLQEAAEATQRNIEHQLGSLVTMALKSIFREPYEFRVRFEQKRNKTECLLLLVRNGEEINPVDAVGGGVLDVISFALRIAFWCLRRTRPFFAFDEPFKFVSANYRPDVGEMIRMLSRRLGLQFLMVSHLEELLPYADNLVEVK
jgi:DNA repair exonuclease SbcCD ATPase subunit